MQNATWWNAVSAVSSSQKSGGRLLLPIGKEAWDRDRQVQALQHWHSKCFRAKSLLCGSVCNEWALVWQHVRTVLLFSMHVWTDVSSLAAFTLQLQEEIQVGHGRRDPELSILSEQRRSLSVAELEVCAAKRACNWFSALDFVIVVKIWILIMYVCVTYVEVFMLIYLPWLDHKWFWTCSILWIDL